MSGEFVREKVCGGPVFGCLPLVCLDVWAYVERDILGCVRGVVWLWWGYVNGNPGGFVVVRQVCFSWICTGA
jgi:hypothetical protein